MNQPLGQCTHLGGSTSEAPNPVLHGMDIATVESSRQRNLREQIESLLEVSWGRRIQLEKRKTHRIGFRKPLTVTPVVDGAGLPEQRFAAFGIDISINGIGFVSRQLLPTRQAVVTCDGPKSTQIHFLFEPRWVRFTRGGWYQLGGKLLRPLDSMGDLEPEVPAGVAEIDEDDFAITDPVGE